MITDWDDAYANADHIAGAEDFIARWPVEAAAFRSSLGTRAACDLAYGEGPRNRVDIFSPEGDSKGLVVFVHGGYWLRFDRSFWSHFAQGPLDAGWTVAMPSYTLTPDISIAGIEAEIAQAIGFSASRVAGPIRLCGHSAGGHLVSRMVCDDSPLPRDLLGRIEHTLSISGVHDLRPLLRTKVNETLGLDDAAAALASPALHRPLEGARITAWVGAEERPEFVRQTTLLANIWTGLGADMAQVKDAGTHHFDVIDGLRKADSPLVSCLLG